MARLKWAGVREAHRLAIALTGHGRLEGSVRSWQQRSRQRRRTQPATVDCAAVAVLCVDVGMRLGPVMAHEHPRHQGLSCKSWRTPLRPYSHTGLTGQALLADQLLERGFVADRIQVGVLLCGGAKLL